MKRPLTFILLVSFLLQVLPVFPTKALSPESSPAPTLNQDYQPSTGDLGFSHRSAVAERFTFKDIPRDLYGDLKSSFWGWGALAFALGAGLSGALVPLDDDLTDSFEPNSLLGSTTNDIVNFAFAPYVYGGVSILLWISGHASHHPQLSLTGRALTEALFLSMTITYMGKFAFRRERPDGGNFSFPSAHASAAFTAAAVLTEFYGWKGALPSYALAGFISVSRVDSYDHFLSDVVMGAVIGSVLGYGTAKYLKKEHPNLFISPEFSREHAALNIYYVF